MEVPVLSRASAALHAALHAGRRQGLGRQTEDDPTKAQGGSRNGNFVCSPLSLLLVFAVAMCGARGQTLQEMRRLLLPHEVPALLRLTTFSSTARDNDSNLASLRASADETRTEFYTASSLYVTSDLASDADFKAFEGELSRKCSNDEYGYPRLPVRLMDCTKPRETAQEINKFVSLVTNGYLTDLVSPADIAPWTKLMVVSAAFFKGPWLTPFEVDDTGKGRFYALQYSDEYESAGHGSYGASQGGRDGSGGGRSEPKLHLVPQIVDMMQVNLSMFDLFYAREDERVTAVGLPYADTEVVMYLVQPKDTKNLEKLMRIQDGEPAPDDFPTFDQVVRSMREERQETRNVEARVTLPKFALKAADNTHDMVPIFQLLLQIEAPFTPHVADFSGISRGTPMSLSRFLHQAEIRLDEAGTVAAAATYASIQADSAVRVKHVNLTFDRPFVFQVRYHPRQEAVAHGRGTPSEEGAAAPDEALLGDYIIFSGCLTDALAAQQ